MKKLTQAEFEVRARSVHGGKYTYGEYIGSGAPMQIFCPVHGDFKQTPNAHVSQRQGCPVCSTMSVADAHRTDTSTLLTRFNAVHGGRYSYNLDAYSNMHRKIEMCCPQHGVFFQSAHSHLKGRGCPVCSRGTQQAYNLRRQQSMQENFASVAGKVHGYAFDYSSTTYTHNQGKVIFRCKKHSLVLTQTARDHLDGYNPCTKCNHMKSSQEEALARFLETFTTVVRRDRTLIAPKEVDIYLPDHKLAVEYCGMYWHSHGDKAAEKQDKRKHFEKYQSCLAAGVRLITVYETEWLENPRAVKRLLRNAIGKSKGRVMARKCVLQKVSNPDARAFYDRFHPQGGAGSGEHYGLFWNGKLLACMRFNYGANDRGAGASNRVWTLGRYATRVTVPGGASRLFKAFLAEHKPPEVKSFSGNRFFSGAMYLQLGFRLEEDVAPDYQVWSGKLGLRPKPHYQRRVLHKRLQEHGYGSEKFDPDTDPRTEAEMTFLMGARRIYDCGKKRWVYTAVDTPTTA